MAKTPGTEQIREAVGSGPFRFLPDAWRNPATELFTSGLMG